MIIVCQNCNKRFNINQNLIPEKGRLLQCNSCNHKWFFKNELGVKTIDSQTIKDIQIFENKKPPQNDYIDDEIKLNVQNKISLPIEKIAKKAEVNKNKKKKKNNYLGLTIVFIISFVAIIILIDTFKSPLSIVTPNLEFLLYNLYESIKDIVLFIRDLI